MLVALYSRVSTQEQAVHGYSINEQIERMKKYADALGWSVYNVYTDAGYSGGTTDRPALKRLVADAKTARFSKVLVYKLDRLSRSQKDTLFLIEDVFLKNNVDFVSMSENFDTATPFGRAMIGILAVFAQLEREQIKERMNLGKSARAKEGKFHGSNQTPIGYEYVDGELITIPFEKAQIQRIYELYAAGKTPKAIARELNDAGMTHRYGKWSDKRIRQLLPKKIYLGYLPHHDTWYKGTHEPFIDEDTYNKCLALFNRRRDESAKYNRRIGKASSYFGGYLFCKHCGQRYVKNTARSKKADGTYYRYDYYSCVSRTSKGYTSKADDCKNKNWRMEELDNLIFGEIKKLTLDKSYFAKMKKESDREQAIREKIKDIDSKLERLIDLYAVGGIPTTQIQARVKRLDEQKKNLEAEADRLSYERNRRLSSDDIEGMITSLSEALDVADFDTTRAIIGALIEKIEIDGEDITIHWKFTA